VVVGCCEMRLVVRSSQSLKDKRQAVRSIKDRIAGTFPVAIAEVGDQDNLQSIVLGAAAVGNEACFVRSVLQKVLDKVRVNPHAEFVTGRIEILRSSLES
jgi:uncharacterized protein YlxP (DUF503 family)